MLWCDIVRYSMVYCGSVVRYSTQGRRVSMRTYACVELKSAFFFFYLFV